MEIFTEIYDYIGYVINKIYILEDYEKLLNFIDFPKLGDFILKYEDFLKTDPMYEIYYKEDIENLKIDVFNFYLNGFDISKIEDLAINLETLQELLETKIEKYNNLIQKDNYSGEVLFDEEIDFLEENKQKILKIFDLLKNNKKQKINKGLKSIIEDEEELEYLFDLISTNFSENIILKDFFDFLVYNFDSNKTFEDFEIEENIKLTKKDFIMIKTNFYNDIERFRKYGH